jgi:Lar family restriction alleviation protein
MPDFKMLPCPFCGSDDIMSFRDDESYTWRIHCRGCGADHGSNAGEKVAIVKWNARMPERVEPKDEFPVDWENDAPMWADFAAVDADGSLYFYEHEPLRRKTYWDLSDGKFLALPDGRKPLRNWEKSLRRREVKPDAQAK